MHFVSRTLLCLVLWSPLALASPSAGAGKAKVANFSLTEAEVLAAQQAWGQALVSISSTHEKQGQRAAKKLAGDVLDKAYGYNMGPVLFKPTLASGDTTFRTSRDGALAYFVGDNKAFPDKGFALMGWRGYSIENAGIILNGDTAITMGKVHLTDKAGKKTTVDKTWGFKKDSAGQIRIVLHHSSLPYQSQ